MTLDAPAVPVVICGSCHLLSGVARLPDGTVGQVYRCDCGRVPKEIVTPPLPKVRPISTWEDIGKTIRRITICTCCGAAVLPAHHRFAPYHCTPCAVRVRSVNALAGQLVVPLGSHSLVNGIDPVEDPAAVPESVWSAASVMMGDRIDEHGPPVFRHVARGREVQQAIRAHQARRTSDLVRRARDAGLIPGPSGGNVLPGQLTAAGRYLWTDYDAALIELVETIAGSSASHAASSPVPTPGEAQPLAEIVHAGGRWRGDPRRDALPVVDATGDITITTADGDRDWVWQLPVRDANGRSRTAEPRVRWTADGDPLLLLASPDVPMVAIAGTERLIAEAGWTTEQLLEANPLRSHPLTITRGCKVAVHRIDRSTVALLRRTPGIADLGWSLRCLGHRVGADAALSIALDAVSTIPQDATVTVRLTNAVAERLLQAKR